MGRPLRTRIAPIVLIALLAVAALPTPSVAHAGGGVVLNLLTGASHGCSPDQVTSPDLAARVWRGGSVIGETYKAQDSSASDWFAIFHLTDASVGQQVAIELREAEPGGFFLLGTSWLPCDVNPGPGAWLNVTLGGGAFSATGDGAAAASVSGHSGTGPHPSVGALTVADRTKTAITFTWTVDAADPADASQRLLVSGRPDVAVGNSERRATVSGLAEGEAYSVRLVRERAPWTAGTPPGIFYTLPPSPTLRATAVEGGADVHVDTRSLNAREAEVHVGPNATFTPDASTRKATVAFLAREADARVRDLAAGVPVHVRAVVVDQQGGRSDPSDAVLVVPSMPPSPLANATLNATSVTRGIRLAWPGIDLSPYARVEVLLSDATSAARVVGTVSASASDTVVEDLRVNATYTFALRGVRASGAADLSRNVTLAWTRAATLPALSLDAPARAAAGASVTALASYTDAEGDAVALVVDWGDGATSSVQDASASHVYAEEGTYRITLRGTDPHSGEASVSRDIVITPNERPTTRLRVSATTVPLGTTLVADLSASTDPEGDPLVFEVSWGDGASDVGEGSLVHRYAKEGRYSIVAVATSRGVAGTPAFAEVNVTAAALPTPPTPIEPPVATPPTLAPPVDVERLAPPTLPTPMPVAPPPRPIVIPAAPAWLAIVLALAAMAIARRLG